MLFCMMEKYFKWFVNGKTMQKKMQYVQQQQQKKKKHLR